MGRTRFSFSKFETGTDIYYGLFEKTDKSGDYVPAEEHALVVEELASLKGTENILLEKLSKADFELATLRAQHTSPETDKLKEKPRWCRMQDNCVHAKTVSYINSKCNDCITHSNFELEEP